VKRHIPRASRPRARLAAALGLGLGLLAAGATTSSASCGVVIDPYTGAIIEIPCADEIYIPFDPNPPCLCPYVDVFVDDRVLTMDLRLAADQSVVGSRVDLVSLNPQPLPPRALRAYLR
jgi:hypothetical protein